jgi:uncharacterized membrane protein
MVRYQRQHTGPNLSNGMIWILGICGIAYIVYKIVSCNYAIKSVSEYEMKEINSDKTREVIITDSTNKIDSPRQ